MKNKGFTLVELLTIIIILAIIAVITVPIITDSIEKAKKQTTKNSAYGITETAKQHYYKLQKENDEIINYSCDFKTGCDDLKYNGEKPKSGNIRINEIGIVTGEVTYKNKYTFCIYDNNVYDGKCEDNISKTLAQEIKIPGEKHIYKPDGTINTNKLAPCIQFDIVVATGTNPIPFCVIGETENTVTLMSKEKIGNYIGWGGNTTNYYGPNVAIPYLLSQTNNWDKIPIIQNYIYDDSQNGTKTYGYKTFEITDGIATITKKNNETEIIGNTENKFRTRLITEEEATEISKGNPFTWMTDTWTLSSQGNNESNAYRILSAASTYQASITGYTVHDSTGLKPVIQIPKENL